MYEWKNNFDLAKVIYKEISLADTNDEHIIEGSNRTIVNKVYYACYHRVMELNKKFGLDASVKSTSSHSDNIHKITRYRQRSDVFNQTELVYLRREMEKLKGYRHDADYLHSGTFNIKKTEYILSKSEEIYNKLMEIF